MKLMKKFLLAIVFLLSLALANALIGEGYDDDGPIVSISAPTPAQVFDSNTVSITLSYSASDVGGGSIAKYWVKIDTNAWIDNGLGSSKVFSGLSTGNYTFYVIAVDDSDNNSTTASVSASISSPPVTAYCGNAVCDTGENCSSCVSDCGSCTQQCQTTLQTCTSSQNCSGSIVSGQCCGTCVAKTCAQLGGSSCNATENDCSAWVDQSTSCCLSGKCTPKQSITVLCSFQEYLLREPITAVFIEPSDLEAAYDFNVLGKEMEITPTLANELADTIVTRYPQLATYLVSANLTDSPTLTDGQVYLLELLKKKASFGTSGYSAKAENFKSIYEFIDASRLRWWNSKTDDTCGVKLDTKNYSLQTMHYFRINNLWLLWSDIARKK